MCLAPVGYVPGAGRVAQDAKYRHLNMVAVQLMANGKGNGVKSRKKHSIP